MCVKNGTYFIPSSHHKIFPAIQLFLKRSLWHKHCPVHCPVTSLWRVRSVSQTARRFWDLHRSLTYPIKIVDLRTRRSLTDNHFSGSFFPKADWPHEGVLLT